MEAEDKKDKKKTKKKKKKPSSGSDHHHDHSTEDDEHEVIDLEDLEEHGHHHGHKHGQDNKDVLPVEATVNDDANANEEEVASGRFAGGGSRARSL